MIWYTVYSPSPTPSSETVAMLSTEVVTALSLTVAPEPVLVSHLIGPGGGGSVGPAAGGGDGGDDWLGGGGGGGVLLPLDDGGDRPSQGVAQTYGSANSQFLSSAKQPVIHVRTILVSAVRNLSVVSRCGLYGRTPQGRLLV